jgi:hypothetical protein
MQRNARAIRRGSPCDYVLSPSHGSGELRAELRLEQELKAIAGRLEALHEQKRRIIDLSMPRATFPATGTSLKTESSTA